MEAPPALSLFKVPLSLEAITSDMCPNESKIEIHGLRPLVSCEICWKQETLNLTVFNVGSFDNWILARRNKALSSTSIRLNHTTQISTSFLAAIKSLLQLALPTLPARPRWPLKPVTKWMVVHGVWQCHCFPCQRLNKFRLRHLYIAHLASFWKKHGTNWRNCWLPFSKNHGFL